MEEYNFWKDIFLGFDNSHNVPSTIKCECGGEMAIKRVRTEAGLDKLYFCSECVRCKNLYEDVIPR